MPMPVPVPESLSRSSSSTTYPSHYSLTPSSQISACLGVILKTLNQSEFTRMAWKAIVEAVDDALQNNQAVGSNHLMKALLKKNGLAKRIFAEAKLDYQSLLQATLASKSKKLKGRGKTTSEPMFRKHLCLILDNARTHKEKMGDNFVSVEHLVLAFHSDNKFGKRLFRKFGLSKNELKNVVRVVVGQDVAIATTLEQYLHQNVDCQDIAISSPLEQSLHQNVVGQDIAIRSPLERSLRHNVDGQDIAIRSPLERSLRHNVDGQDTAIRAALEPPLPQNVVGQDVAIRAALELPLTQNVDGQDIAIRTTLEPSLQQNVDGQDVAIRAALEPSLHHNVVGQDIAIRAALELSPHQNVASEDIAIRSPLEQSLYQNVVGQDIAIRSALDVIQRSRAGLSNPNRPIGVFMLMGPPGVGKSEFAKVLATSFFDEDALIQVCMAQYTNEHTTSCLIGAPLGHEYGDPVTEKVRRRPHSVVFFDKIEKAHDDVFKILLQLVVDGKIIDSRGRAVSFANCIIIMTSSIGSDYILETHGTMKDNKDVVYESLKNQVVGLARQTFRSEFMNQIDECLVFQPFDSTQLCKIVEIKIKELCDKLKQRKNITLHYTKESIELIGTLCFDPRVGALKIWRVIKNKVEGEIVDQILSGSVQNKNTIIVYVDASSSSTEGLSSRERLCIKKLDNNSSFACYSCQKRIETM